MPHTLLLADPSATTQRVINLTFAETEVAVVACSDGEAALRLLDDRRPDIVLADIELPGVSGYDLARHIAGRPRLADIPVLLLSGALDPVDDDRAREAGAIGVIAKPLQPGQLVRQVSERLAAHRTVTPAVAAPEQVSASEKPWTLPAVVPFESPASPHEATPADAVSRVQPVAPATHVAPRSAATQALDDYFASLDEAINARAARILESPLPPAPDEPLSRSEDDAESRPILASAFSALLDAESAGEDDAELASWFVQPSQPVKPVITDDLLEEVTRRVISRLSDRVVRETVADLVSQVAERLVAQEIERIKSHIK